jgi:hypothetical protein
VSESGGGIAATGGPSAISWGCAEPSIRRSTIGRPRRLTDQQVAWVLKEYARFVAWRLLRSTVRSQRQLARDLGVSQATVSLAVRLGGRYKQCSPEVRVARRNPRRGT